MPRKTTTKVRGAPAVLGFQNYSNPRPLNTPGPFNPPKQKQPTVKIAKPRNVTAGTINTNPAQGRMPRPGLPRGNTAGADGAFAKRDALIRPTPRATNTIASPKRGR